MEYSSEFYQAILNQLFKQLDSQTIIDAVVAAMDQVPELRRYTTTKKSEIKFPEVDALLQRLDQKKKK